jgi:enamine deaminase RidA (YjgF/YER057c/UK114 family)
MLRPGAWLSVPARLGTTLFLVSGPAVQAQMTGPEFINPPGLTRPKGYTHGVGDFPAQAEQVFANLRRALASVGASFADVLKATTFITDLGNLPALREARARYIEPARPPANTFIAVPALAGPDLLLEIEAVVDLSRGRRR